MSTTHKLLRIPFWLAVLMGVLGCVMTFVLSLLELVLSIIVAIRGFGRGMKYYEGAAIHQTTK
jgi:hypothetical protein